jgi:hypothetical protein
MTSKRLKQLAANPRHIPGVYNYCDRWCERCPLTSRCLTYAMEQDEKQGDPAEHDLNSKKFWNALADSFRLVAEMIEEDCKERGIDFAKIQREAQDEALKEKLDRRRRRRREHPLVEEGTRYMKATMKWFERHEHLFKDKSAQLESALVMNLPGQADPVAVARDVIDAVEVIRWYHMFIGVKIARAVGHDDFDDDDDDDDDSGPNTDALGSAKIALIAMDRSLAAWARLRTHLADDADAMIDLLVRLDRLRKRVEAHFPTARAFVRPGWDDGTLG